VASALAPVRPTNQRAKKRPRSGLRSLTKVLLSVGLGVTTFVLGGEWALHQPFFGVQHVRFVGLVHERPQAVLGVSGLASHPAMLGLSSSSLDQRLTSFPWIGGVSLTKHWPNSVVVTVRERVAVAVAFDPHHVLQYVDRSGDDLGPAPLQANLPTLSFVNATKPTWPFARAGRSAAYVAGLLPRAFSAQVSVVSEDDHGIVTLKMTTPVSFVLGPPTDLKAKFVSIASVIAHSTLHAGDVVDVSVPGALAVTGPPLT
jgi:cell division protein FtsQ